MTKKNKELKSEESTCEDVLVTEERDNEVEHQNETSTIEVAPTPQKDLLQPPTQTKPRKPSAFAGTIVEVRDKNGLLKAAVPFVPVPVAWFILFFNIFTPGIGTLIMAFAALCGAPTNSKKPNKCVDFLLNLIAGLLQTLTALLIIGWIWSMFWGMHIVTQANDYKIRNKNKKKPIYNPPAAASNP